VTLTLLLVFALSWFIRIQARQERKKIRENLEKIRDQTIQEELIVKFLSKKSKEKISASKANIKDLIEDRQETNEISDKVISILFSLGFLGFLWVIGIPLNLGEPIFYIATTTLVTIFIKPLIESTGRLTQRSTIRRLKKCLLLLEEAQAMAETIEANKNIIQSK
jgi:ABC-type transport system involved in cytochrome bd biosynthesis fused ATPase/permease subunit